LLFPPGPELAVRSIDLFLPEMRRLAATAPIQASMQSTESEEDSGIHMVWAAVRRTMISASQAVPSQ